MAHLTISCSDLGSPCPSEALSGDTMDDLLEAFYRHATVAHGKTLEQLKAPEMHEVVLSNIKQSARPRANRSTRKLDL